MGSKPFYQSIFITGLRCEALIGVLPHEQHQAQPLLIDCEVAIDASLAAKNDCIDDTLDYGALRNHILKFTSDHHFQLLETLAERLADSLQKTFQAPKLTLRINKPTAFDDVTAIGVALARSA